MKVSDFLNKISLAVRSKTLYVRGGIGAPLTDAMKEKYTSSGFNAKLERKKKIMAASNDTFSFDCSGLIKGILWGWDGSLDKTYGGAIYKSNGVPDTNANGLIAKCPDATTDFSNIEKGELLWNSGHVGIYIGDGWAVECTYRWDDGVQVTQVFNIKGTSDNPGRTWTKHGHLPYIDYTPEIITSEIECPFCHAKGTISWTK